MTLMELMKALSFTTPLLVPPVAGLAAGGGFGLFVGFLVGLLLGPGCFLGTRAFDQWIDRHPEMGNADADSSFLLKVVDELQVWGLFIWIFGVSTLGFYLTERLTRSLSF